MDDNGDDELSQSDWDFVLEAAQGFTFTPLRGSVLRGGRINETWRIETSEGSLVLRRYPSSRRPHQIQFELSLMTHLAQCGCKVPMPLETDVALISPGASVGRKQHPHAWFCYIDGRPIVPQSDGSSGITPRELGTLLVPVFSAFHDFSPPFRPVAETHIFASQVKLFLSALPSSHAQKLGRVLDELVRWEQAYRLPAGVIHADIYPGNVLRDQTDALWLIDFDDAHVGSRALDWVMAAAEFSFVGADLKKARYEAYLEALRPPFATTLERESENQLLQLILFKCAINEHALGANYEENRYVRLLLQDLE